MHLNIFCQCSGPESPQIPAQAPSHPAVPSAASEVQVLQGPRLILPVPGSAGSQSPCAWCAGA